MRYDERGTEVFYRDGQAAPGDNIAYLQREYYPTSFVCMCVLVCLSFVEFTYCSCTTELESRLLLLTSFHSLFLNVDISFYFFAVGVPTYRISQMIRYGGNVLDAYAIVNIVSPSGLPIRGIIGISPDPIMFVAINTIDLDASVAFYNKLGFVEQVCSNSCDGLWSFLPTS